jgi:hypothetical protein
MSSSLDWQPMTLYRVTLNTPNQNACLHGFRGSNRSQLRYFADQSKIDEYIGELWIYGLSDVTIEEYKNE